MKKAIFNLIIAMTWIVYIVGLFLLQDSVFWQSLFGFLGGCFIGGLGICFIEFGWKYPLRTRDIEGRMAGKGEKT